MDDYIYDTWQHEEDGALFFKNMRSDWIYLLILEKKKSFTFYETDSNPY